MQTPYIPPEKKVPEFTVKAVIIGIIIGVIMTASNIYLGLYAGMTVSASIPAAVISMGILRGVMRKGTILENNIVQTIASAGESLAAGIIFTVPALVIIGVWSSFQFWTTMFIALTGGFLGIIFMIPIRRILIVDDKELIYPEGVACSEVLKAGETGKQSIVTILVAVIIGGMVKLATSGLKLVQGTVEGAFRIGNRAFFMGTDVSPALIGVGYIIKLEIAALVFFGGAVAWIVTIPILGIPDSLLSMSTVEAVWNMWKSQIRFMGVGAMVVGGIWSIISIRKGIASGIRGIVTGARETVNSNDTARSRTDTDIKPIFMALLFLVTLAIVIILYHGIVGSFGISFMSALLMVVTGFFFVAVSSYIVGLVGSSNNPVSGMTISALLLVSAIFLILGWKGNSAIFATLGMAGVVCCATCTAGDVSQDLKTGYILGATPQKQQAGQIIGVIMPALIIAPVLTLLHSAYGIGTGLKAPQATLFASIVKALFGNGKLPMDMVFAGAVLACLLIAADLILQRAGTRIRLHVMPIAVGIYLPFTLTVPMVLGGFIRYFSERQRDGSEPELQDSGILVSSGLIAGEALMGILLAVFIVLQMDMSLNLNSTLVYVVTGIAMVAVLVYLYRQGIKNNSKQL